jgi:predicted ATPase
LLLDPRRFLFNHEPAYDNDGRMMLSFRKHQLYGREDQVTLITEAFCRVSSGKSESLFIGGFSGSGKSRLVNGLMPRIDAVGGYVLTHKFDQMSQEKSILDVVTMFNELCLLIKEKSSQRNLLVLVDELVQVFGSDWSTLARLLPNINAIVPQLERSAVVGGEVDNQMNVRSICFTLQRFLRVVSSAANPVMLFLDDLQWCAKPVFTVVESLICDAMEPPCLFFVGSYRSNEVADDHEIHCLAQRLKSFGVPTTMLSLEGLDPSALNTMVSDALCIFPRITEPLSIIIHQKTEGNPFFVLAFMRSLVERELLQYSFDLRRWVWDHDDVSSMDVTGNVLYLLSSKMNRLSTSIQSALKVAACFGTKIEESVVKTLSNDPEYSDIRDKLNQVVKEGFMVKGSSSEFKFVHDKVREAAYSLIPEKDKAHVSWAV